MMGQERELMFLLRQDSFECHCLSGPGVLVSTNKQTLAPIDSCVLYANFLFFLVIISLSLLYFSQCIILFAYCVFVHFGGSL